MRVSNSKLKTFRRCQNQYRYKYVEKLEPKAKALALERGTWIHELLQTHYDGEDWKSKHKELSQKFFDLFEEDREDLGDLPSECSRIMRSYLRQWKEQDQHFHVVDTELDEIVTLPNGLELNVIVDMIVEDKRSGLLWPWDHKTRKSFETSDNMLLDPQGTLYFKALQILGYEPLGGFLYNEIRTKAPAVPERLKNGQLSRRMNIDTDYFTYMTAIRQHDLNPLYYKEILAHIATNQKERFFRRVALPKDPPMIRIMTQEMIDTANDIAKVEKRGRFTRTFIPSQCKWDCSYKDLCITELHGGDIEPLIKMSFNRRQRGK